MKIVLNVTRYGGLESGHQVYVHEAIAQLSHWPYVKVPCLGISKGHEISSGSGAQKSTGFSIINDNISHSLGANNLCQWISIQQSRWQSIMLLPCSEICRGRVWTVVGKGGNTGLIYPYLLLPTHFNFLYFTQFEGVALSDLPLSQSIWTGLSLWEPAGSCLSLQVPRRCLKIQGQTFHIPHHRIDVPPCYT